MSTHLDPHTSTELSFPEGEPGAIIEDSGTSETIWDIELPLNLSDIQFRAIELTIQGMRDTQIAQSLSVDRKTLWRWKTHDEDYQQALTSARIYLHGTTADRCQTIAQKAAGVLAKFLDNTDDKIRLQAAHILLSVASRFKPVTPRIRPQASVPEDDWPPPILGPKMG